MSQQPILKQDCGTAAKPSAESEEPSVSEEAGTVKIEPNVEPNVEVSEDKEPEESSNGTHDLTEVTEPPNEDSAMETDEKDDEATEKVSDYVEIEMDGDEEYPEVKCEIESTKKRITKKRKSATDNDVGYDISGEKKKRHYVKSGEFSGNMADRQRALVAYACDLCGAKYNDLDDLEKHRGSHEEIDDEDGSTVMKCTECDGKFITPELLEEHVKQKHKRLLKLHRCHLCQFSSERRFDLKKHLVIHTGIKNYMCDQCGKCMSTPYNLKIHYLRLHATEEEKNITCSEDDCDFKCADKAVLKDHLRQKHNLMIDNRDSEKVEKIKLFSCKHCDYTGKKESSLRYHMRIHLENRQHKCKLCPYASKTKNNLILHMRTHDGMQPVKCSQCDFRGATNKIISEHILSKHAGIRPYRCLVCKWSTSYSGNMWKHIHDHRSELGDAMPAEPVEVVTGEGVAIPVPLRPPSGRKRTKLYPPRQYSRSPAADNLKAISKEFQAAHTARVDALSQLLQVNASGANPEETVTIVEVPIPMGEGESSVIMGGSESATTSALNSLAAAVATAREVALLSQQAQAVISGQQGTDSSNPYPVSQLFQQIAGQASGSQQLRLLPPLWPLPPGNEVIIAVTSPDSLQQAVLQSGITSSSQPGSVGVTDQTKVTYTIARPQGGGEEEVQFTVQPDIHFENQSAVADIPDPEESHVESDHVYVSINESDLHVAEDDRQGHTLQIVESSAVKDHVSCEQNTEVEEHNVSQLVTMIPEGELVMSMVPTASQSNPTYVSDSQQPVEAHIVVSDPENPGQYIQQEIHYVQTNENGEAILEQNGTTQVVHIVQQENGELAYQDSDGQVYTAENTQVMFQPAEQSEQDFIPNEIPEAITISDADGRLGIPDSEQLVSSEGHLVGVAEGVDQQEVQIAVAAEFIDQDHQVVDHINEDQLDESKNEQSHENIEAMPEDLTTTPCTGESDSSKVLSTASLEEGQDDEDLKTSSIEEPVENEDLPPDVGSDVQAQSEK
ncbi:putative zinc finger protein [Apostichopus japonicus]|uniref:Putative zinc finger protein n=1 Tax=Stichopus japonicus TaxID=307972 RepID=A0A2G8K6Q0_STIJA|nr:putative zinc finger protein [Apostichopus japonicus]